METRKLEKKKSKLELAQYQNFDRKYGYFAGAILKMIVVG